MQIIEVGKPYKEGLISLPEGVIFDFDQSGGIVRIAYNSPTSEEIQEIKQGNIKLGLLEKNGILFFLVKFGGLDWMDCPYHPDLSEPYTLEEINNDVGYGVTVVLLNAQNGIVEVIRLLGLPSRMSKKFKQIVEGQRGKKPADYDARLRQIYSNYETPDLVKLADTYTLKT